MEASETYLSLGLALASGFLMGLQREHSAAAGKSEQDLTPGGIRTYPLVALLGALCALLSGLIGVWIIGAGFLAVLVPLMLGYFDDLRRNHHGVTSEMALILCFLLGVLSNLQIEGMPLGQRLLLVSSIAVAATAMLSMKLPLHHWVEKLTHEDLYATVKFAVAAVIVLPLLPDKAYGPFEAFNPFHIGTMIVLIAAISFLGYVAMRILGPGRGLGVTGLLGGLVSSTAVTMALSNQAKRTPALMKVCGYGVIIASTVMAARVLVVVGLLNRELLAPLFPALGGMMLAGLAVAAFLYLRSRNEATAAEGMKLTNPFEFSSALKFGLFFAAILLAARAANHYLGTGGLYLTGVVGGLADVDAVAISTAKMNREALDPATAAIVILLACAANTFVKGGMAVALGGWSFGWRVLVAFGIMTSGGAAGLTVYWMTG